MYHQGQPNDYMMSTNNIPTVPYQHILHQPVYPAQNNFSQHISPTPY
jgi:hypothetical protein